MQQRVIATPMGDMLLGAQAGRLCKAVLLLHKEEVPDVDDADPVLDEAQRQIVQYLQGEREVFDLPLQMDGSVFDCAVWRMLQEIPYGAVETYGQIAAALGRPKASRAVGGACSRNPLLIVVPCHRVIAATGRLTGFAAGLEAKKALLSCEGWTIENGKIQDKHKELPG